MGQKKGPWTPEEDFLLTKYIQTHGEGHWRTLPNKAGLQRCGKGCRLRWMNYLRPNVKRGNISKEEEELIIRLHKLLGNRWSLIAGRVPGRTDNEIKNYWNTRLSKKLHCKAVVNKTDYHRNTVSYSDLKQNVFQQGNARDVQKREIFNTEYFKTDCMNRQHGFSAAEGLITSSVFNGADFLVYDNQQAHEYIDHTVNYQTYMDMSDIFSGKFIYNEMDALSQFHQMCGVGKTMFGDPPQILPSTNHQEAFLLGDLTASQQTFVGNGADSSDQLRSHQSSLLSGQAAIEYNNLGYVDSPPAIFADQAHLLSTLFDESNDCHTSNSLLLNYQGTGYEEARKPNAWIEPQSLDQDFLVTCFNQFLDSTNGW